MEFQRGFTDGEFLIDDYIEDATNKKLQEKNAYDNNDIHDLVDHEQTEQRQDEQDFDKKP